ALSSGSPAINAGDPATTGDFDQRGVGFARIIGRVDIGAYESNQPPVIGLSPGTRVYREGDPPILIDPGAIAADADNADFNGGTLTVDFTAGGTAEDRLAIANQGSGPGQVGVSGSTIFYGGIAVGTFTGGDGTVPLVVTFNANAISAAVQAVLRNVTYANVSESPSTAARTVRFVLTDGDGGTSDPATVSITIAALNDAPVLNPTGQPKFDPINEGDTNNNGTRVADLIAGNLISDVDASALQGIAVVGVDNGNGAWQFSTDGGSTWIDFGVPSDTNARLLAADTLTRIRFVPASGFFGTVTNGLTFRAWDQTSGVNGGTADASQNGGATAFSSTVAVASIAVAAQPAVAFSVSVVSSATSGEPVAIIVTALDFRNQTANAYRGTIHFASSDAAATLPADYTFTSADNGTHTFLTPTVLRTAGSQTLTVTDAANSLQGSASLTVANVAPSNLALTLSAAALLVGQSLSLDGSFTDPGTGDQHTVTIDWGDGSPATVLTLTPGVRTFSTTHRYDVASKADTDTVHVTVADDHGGSTNAAASVVVRDIAPVGATLDLSATALDEGQSLTLTGTFDAPNSFDAHTITIDWGDGSEVTKLALAPQIFSFQATHRYDESHPDGKPLSSDVIQVTITDEHGGSASATATVTVSNIAPAVTAGPLAFIAVGTLFVGSGQFTDPGNDGWTIGVDYGDGSKTETLPFNSDRTFGLQHVYDQEGSFIVSVTVTDGNGGQGIARFFVNTYVAGPLEAHMGIAEPGGSVTEDVDGLHATLDHAPDGLGNAAILVVQLPTEAAAVAASTLATFTVQLGTVLSTYDVRALNVSDRDVATLVFEVDSPTGAVPVVSFFDPVHGFAPVSGSEGTAAPVLIESIHGMIRYRITIVLDAFSTPRLRDLNGTILTTSIPTVQTPTSFTGTPTMLAGAMPRSGDGLGLDALPTVTFSRTGLAGGSQRSAASALTQATLPDFGAGGETSTVSNAVLVRELLAATHAGFWEGVADSPAPVPPDPVAPTPTPTPTPGGMDEAALSAALADLFALAGQTLPVLPAVGMVPVGDLGTALPLYSLGQSPSHIVAIQDDGDGEGQAAVASEGAGVSPALAGTDVPKRAHPRGSLMATAFLVCWSLLLLGRRLTPPEAFGELWREARSRGPQVPRTKKPRRSDG
ncbi:MAG TPA: PKD domain-containing protein, partial [Gemmataceae bacterium]|nr:PKD domain-containing protein [Gemmataceae bacterium]